MADVPADLPETVPVAGPAAAPGGERGAGPHPSPRRIADGYVDQLVAVDPVLATSLGVGQGQDRWPDWSPEGLAERAELQRRTLRELDTAEAPAGGRGRLEAADRRCARLLRERLEAELTMPDDGEGLRRLDTLFSPPQTPRQALTLMPTGTGENWENVAGRLERVPGALDAYRASLVEGRDRDLVGERARLAGRDAARRAHAARGDAFDLEAWHMAALSQGSLGLDDLVAELSAL
jgi:uncharacterized protein (DUF885 family)